MQLRNITDEYKELKGHEGPILHIDISSKDLLASSSGDGTIRIWSLGGKAATVVKKLEGFSKFNEFSAANVYSTPSFDAQGNLLAYPKDKAIFVLDTTNWETKFKLENNEIIGKYSVCSFSPCDKFMGAGSLEGEISVWNVAEKSKLKGQYAGEDKHSITSISWNPKKSQGELAFCDNDGQLSSVNCTIKAKMDKIFEEEEAEEVADERDDLYGDIEFREDEAPEDEENENCISLERLKNETLNQNGDSDDDMGSEKSLPTSIVGFEHYPVPKPFPIQNPFQPGSTPVSLEHRFMVWNHVGQVVCHSAEENSIIAEFHDVTIQPSLHILNNLKHEMASLSTACLALATKQSPCRLVCIAFISAGSKEWSTAMPECEEIQAVAAGDNFVAVATDARIIRFFTTMGTQREVVAVAGPVVALSASENNLAVAYHTSEVSDKFSLMIITLIGPTMTSRVIDVPLAANTKLTWLGFSDMGSVIAYDSSGRVTSYSIKRNIWFPICDMNEHVSGGSDKFFIISVSERNQKIRATLCRGINYPLTNPRPIVREVDYAIPLCYMETEKSKLEEALVRANTFNTDSSEKTIYEKGLKLFSSAMNSELESRAFEIVELIGDRRLIELAAKYASQKGRIHMANKISKLLVDIDEKERQKEELIQAFEADADQFSDTCEMESSKAADKRAQETSTPVIAPKPMISQKKSNPFKKGGLKLTSTPTTALDHLTKKSIAYKQTYNSDDENTPTNNISSSRPIGMDTPRPGKLPGRLCLVQACINVLNYLQETLANGLLPTKMS